MTAENSPIRDRPSALEFLFGRIDYERTRSVPYRSRRFKLDRMQQLAAMLGEPQRQYPAVHIAGTKGKGSTAQMVASALSAAGLRTGLYTSPHLHRLEERFVVDGRQCSESQLVDLLASVQPAVRQLDKEAVERDHGQGPTYFEITTAAALLHFQRAEVDCAVLEVGLGGRLDSTNICHPAVSVITTISLDHTRQLGKTLALIAGEKAGIIKPGVPVVTGVRQQEPLEVIESVARKHNAPLKVAGRHFDFHYRGLADTEGGAAPQLAQSVFDFVDLTDSLDGAPRQWSGLRVGMLGRHQVANAAVAWATLRQLRRGGWSIEEDALRRGLAQAHCAARFEIVGQRPTIILDVAHNPASISALCASLREQFPDRPRLLIFAASVDKDVPNMLKPLFDHFQEIVFTRFLDNPRAMAPEKLAAIAQQLSHEQQRLATRWQHCPDPRTAAQLARSFATPEHVICVAGSFFLAAEIRRHLEPSGSRSV